MLLKVTDRDGGEFEVTAAATDSLMQPLRELDWGVVALCGGSCACATCHVYVAPEWQDRLPLPQSDEREVLTSLEHVRETSRLSCQIRLLPELDGLRVTLAPEE